MGRYVMVVQSSAKDGRDQEYNDWYDRVHMGDVRALAGIRSGRRFEATSAMIGTPGGRYLSIFEVETDDPEAVLADMNGRSMDGRMAVSDSLEPTSVALWFYKQRE
jgi:hypothetical protein